MGRLGEKGTIWIAVGLATLGFLLIFLGWNGAAEKDFVEGQIPFVISGGIAGLGLVAAGLTLALVEARRRDTARLSQKIDRLLEHMGAEVAEPEAVDRMISRRKSRRPESKAS